MKTSTHLRKDRRLEIRTTAQDRELIERAAAATGTDITGFVSEHAVLAARRALADQTAFALDAEEAAVWEALLTRPARDLPGLRALLDRPAPWDED